MFNAFRSYFSPIHGADVSDQVEETAYLKLSHDDSYTMEDARAYHQSAPATMPARLFGLIDTGNGSIWFPLQAL